MTTLGAGVRWPRRARRSGRRTLGVVAVQRYPRRESNSSDTALVWRACVETLRVNTMTVRGPASGAIVARKRRTLPTGKRRWLEFCAGTSLLGTTVVLRKALAICCSCERFGPDRQQGKSHKITWTTSVGARHKGSGSLQHLEVTAILHQMLRSCRWTLPEDGRARGRQPYPGWRTTRPAFAHRAAVGMSTAIGCAAHVRCQGASGMS